MMRKIYREQFGEVAREEELRGHGEVWKQRGESVGEGAVRRTI